MNDIVMVDINLIISIYIYSNDNYLASQELTNYSFA